MPKAHWTKIILKIVKDNISEWEARFLRNVHCNVSLSFLRLIIRYGWAVYMVEENYEWQWEEALTSGDMNINS